MLKKYLIGFLTLTFSTVLVLSVQAGSKDLSKEILQNPSAVKTPAVTSPPVTTVPAPVDKRETKQPSPLINTAKRCPDPAILNRKIDLIIGDRYDENTSSYTLKATIRNVGGSPYISNPKQQEIMLIEKEFSKPDRVVLRQPFRNLSPGQDITVTYRSQITRYNEVYPYPVERVYELSIVYDPDIRIDGNPQNDDCRSSNNKVSLPVDSRVIFRD